MAISTTTFQQLSHLAKTHEVYAAQQDFAAADRVHEQWRVLAGPLSESDWADFDEWASA